MRSMGEWMAILAMATSTLACSVPPAAADWQYTQWGMTPDQVRAASNDAAQPNLNRTLDAGGLKAVLTAPYQGATLPFTAVFLFDDGGKLKLVTLDPIGDIACPVIVQALRANHGMPKGKADMVHATTLRWDDVESDNLIVYLDLGHGNCTVQFSRLPHLAEREEPIAVLENRIPAMSSPTCSRTKEAATFRRAAHEHIGSLWTIPYTKCHVIRKRD